MSAEPPVLVVGAGIAGLCAAARLAHAGRAVTLLERAPAFGGKLRAQAAGDQAVDAGPTVLTLKPWFEAMFDELGESLDEQLPMRPLPVLARHAWADGSRLDLFADAQRSAEAIGELAGLAEARRYLAFRARCARMFRALEFTHMRAPRPTPWGLAWRAWRQGGLRACADLSGIAPFTPMMQALHGHFQDPRLRQLFGRYATYCGSSPWAAPATLMLVAEAEQRGVWQIEGGMRRLAEVLARLAVARGAVIRCGAEVAQVLVRGGRARGVRLADGECLPAEHLVWAADARALADGLAGDAARQAVPRALPRQPRSLSAVTWTARGAVQGFEPAHHTVCFSDDGASEFRDVFQGRALPHHPTVYLCAQDRGAGWTERTDGATGGPKGPGQPERLFWLVNAPAAGDALTDEEIDQCEFRTQLHLRRCGLRLHLDRSTLQRTAPADFARRFPATAGALYGTATHGWRASFVRPGARSGLAGLWMAGGSVHPGPGLPMAATSGWLAAQAVLAARSSRTLTAPWRTAPMPGGTSTP